MTIQQITLESMTAAHLDGAIELSRQVNWPHRREDWEFVQSLSQGVVALEAGRVVATALMTPYGDDGATVNMIIVDAAMRGRGLGRKLMEEALAKAGGRTCYLVATREGLPLYEKLGFVTSGRIVQHQGEALPADLPEYVSWSEKGDLARLVALDRAAFGHDRSALMRSLSGKAKFAVIREGDDVQAFGAIRPFGRGLVTGPVVARNGAEAKTLIDFLLAHHQGSFVRVDTHESTELADWLTGRGLTHAGGGIAMRRAGGAQKERGGIAMRRAGGAQKESGIAQHRTYALVSQALR